MPNVQAMFAEALAEGDDSPTLATTIRMPLRRNPSSMPNIQEVVLEAKGTFQEQWQFVWCHERCHKQELEPLREVFTETVEQANGNFMCLKKATGFGRWLSRVSDMPFVLLADWREAKPCVEVLLQQPHEQTQIIVVYTEQDKQFKQASRWAASLPSQGYHHLVHVIPSTLRVEDLADYVVRLLRSHFPGMAAAAGQRSPTPPRSRNAFAQGSAQDAAPHTPPRKQPAALDDGSPLRQTTPLPPGVWVSPTSVCSSPVTPVSATAFAWPADMTTAGIMPCAFVAVPTSCGFSTPSTCASETGMPLRRASSSPAVDNMCMWGGASDCNTDSIINPLEGKFVEHWQEAGQPPLRRVVSHPACMSTFVNTEGMKWARPVADLMGSMFPVASTEDVQNMLKWSAPDHYED